jgi:hypothetical protein
VCDLQIIVYYNFTPTANDRSKEILKESEPLFQYKFIWIERPHCPHVYRTKRIAAARNGILQTIRDFFPFTDYFIMMDSNEYSCIGEIQLPVFQEMIARSDEWDSVSFDREAGYYDHWALSFDPFIYSFFHFRRWSQAVEKLREVFGKNMADWKAERPDELMPVFSAFNGFSIYKTAVFLDCVYSSETDMDLIPEDILDKQIEIVGQPLLADKEHDCEHRAFHLQAIKIKGARIRISMKSLFARFTGTLDYEPRGPV